MINVYKEGGARIIDIVTFNQSLKVTWIKKYLDLSNNGKWKKPFCSTFRKLGIHNAFKCNLDKKDIREMNM